MDWCKDTLETIFHYHNTYKQKTAKQRTNYPAILDPLVITVVIFAKMTACRKDTFFMYS